MNGAKAPSPNHKSTHWLTLGQASRLLGVHPTTLRQWADSGQVRAFRTPGGHRRFAEEDLRKFTKGGLKPIHDLDLRVQSALGRARREFDEHGLVSEGWYRTFFDEEEKSTKRELGRRLLDLAIRYAMVEDSREQVLQEGRLIGESYGHDAAQRGLSISDTVRAFLFFRDAVIDAIIPAISTPGQTDEEDIRVYHQIKRFMNEVLFTTLGAYQMVEEASSPLSEGKS